MAQKMSNLMKTNFELSSTVEAIYTGGSLQLSSDGFSIFCTCGDTVNKVDIKSGKATAKFKDDGDDITSFAVSPDGKLLITASRSLLLHKFSINDNVFIDRWKIAQKTPIYTMVFDQTSSLLATGSSDSNVKVYDSEKKYCTHNFKGGDGAVMLVKFHPVSNKLVLFSSYNDGKIRMWDLKTSKCLWLLDGHLSAVTSLVFSSDNQLMVSAGRDKVLIIWDLHLRQKAKTIPSFECIEGLSIVPSPDSDKHKEYFVSAGESGNLRMWNLPNGQCILTNKSAEDVSGCSKSSIFHLLYDNIGEQLICVTYDHNIIFYDANVLKPQKQFIGFYDEIVDIKYFGLNQEYIAVASNSEQIKVIHCDTSASEIIYGHSGTVLSLDVSYDGKYIASASKDNTISVWCKDDNTEKFCRVAVGKGHTHHVCCVAWPKSSTNYLVSSSKDLTIKCWTLPSKLLPTETVDLQVKWTENAHDKDINVVSVSPNDKLIVSASQDKLGKIWKLKSGSHVGILRGHKRGIWCAEFSPVDQCIATGSVDATIKLWALSNYTCVKTFEGHTNSVLRLYFCNRGMQLISSGSEGLIKVWSIQNDECVSTVEGHDDKVWAMALSKSENFVVTGGADSTIKLWKDITEQTIEEQEKAEENKIQQEQEMMNLIQQEKFDKAVELAIILNHPHRALKVFKQILSGQSGENILQEVITGLPINYLEDLLSYLCDWNTNARNSFISQSILTIILKTRLSDDILELPKIKEIIESLLPYTERHYERVNRLVHQSMFVNYSWESMKLPLVELPKESSTIEVSNAIE